MPGLGLELGDRTLIRQDLIPGEQRWLSDRTPSDEVSITSCRYGLDESSLARLKKAVLLAIHHF